MKNQYKILILEDNIADIEFIKRILKRSDISFDSTTVSSKAAFIDAIQNHSFDVILSDHSLPQFSSLEALEEVKKISLEMPFILVTGTVSEEFAVSILQQGADDYILKSNLGRLPSAINRVVENQRIKNEKRNAEKALKKSELRYRTLVEHASDGILMTHVNGDIIDVNSVFEIMTGYAIHVLREKNLSDILFKEDLTKIPLEFAKLKTSKSVLFESMIKRKDNTFLEVEISTKVLPGGENLISIVRDVAERKRLQENIRQSEKRYRQIVETSQEGIWLLDAYYRSLFVNKKMSEILEYSPGQMIGRSVLDFMDNEDKVPLLAAMRGKKRKEDKILELRFKTSTGKHIWVSLSISAILDEKQNFTGALAMVTNITERKKADEDLKQSHEQLRQLAAHLQDIREEERAAMSREIHDELGQQLTGLKLDLSWLESKAGIAQQHITDKLKSMSGLVSNTINTVRKIAADLRPSVLDDLGLVEAMKWLSTEFEKRSGIKVKFVSKEENILVADNTAIALFRIYQESLTNVGRHAAASSVNTTLQLKRHQLVLAINDNGKGFDATEVGSKKTLGLLGMKERTIMIGGKYSIVSKIGKGTKVTVTVPMQMLLHGVSPIP